MFRATRHKDGDFSSTRKHTEVQHKISEYRGGIAHNFTIASTSLHARSNPDGRTPHRAHKIQKERENQLASSECTHEPRQNRNRTRTTRTKSDYKHYNLGLRPRFPAEISVLSVCHVKGQVDELGAWKNGWLEKKNEERKTLRYIFFTESSSPWATPGGVVLPRTIFIFGCVLLYGKLSCGAEEYAGN
jgi:hypothetical protein